MTTIEEVTQAPALQPRALIVTIYGLYAREEGGWISVASLIKMLSTLGVDEPAVRSSISRLKRRGILEAQRVGGVAGYGLSAQARMILDEGDRRIFDRPQARTEEGWVLAVFSVPESERQQRHVLRSRLAWLGYGTVAAGVWIAPAHVAAETRDALRRHQLESYVDLFRADHMAFGPLHDKVQQWWDLNQVQALYADFVTSHAPLLSAWRRRRASAEAAAFRDYVRTLTAWRRLPYLDPGLGDDVLPPGWKGRRAAELFTDLRQRLAEPAHNYVDSLR